jgi:predicted permease
VLTLAPILVVYNVIGVVVLLVSQHALGWGMARPLAKQRFTNPPLLATVAGIGWALAGWTMPPTVNKTCYALGEIALPLGLLGVGGATVAVQRGGNWQWPLGAALMKAAISPALAWLVGRGLGLGNRS